MQARSGITTSFARVWFYLAAVLVVIGPSVAEEIPLGSRGGTFSIPVRLNDSITLNFVLDTGASNVVIPADVVSTLLRTGTLSERDFVDRTTYVLADGSKLPSLRFVLHEVRVGNQSAQNVVASVSPARGDPLLGQSFLSKLPPWTLDYSRNALVVNENALPSRTAAVAPPPVTSPPSPAPPAPIGPQFGYGSFGAFAYDESSGQYGLSWNEYDQSRADYAALLGCVAQGGKVVFRTGPRECGAIATNEDGKAWGGAKRPRRDAAELAAMQNCQHHTKGQCKIRGAECNR